MQFVFKYFSFEDTATRIFINVHVCSRDILYSYVNVWFHIVSEETGYCMFGIVLKCGLLTDALNLSNSFQLRYIRYTLYGTVKSGVTVREM